MPTSALVLALCRSCRTPSIAATSTSCSPTTLSRRGFKNYRDLAALDHHLDDWRQRLDAFDDMVDTRRRAYAGAVCPRPSSAWRRWTCRSCARGAMRSPRAWRRPNPATTSPHSGRPRKQDRWQRLAAVEADAQFDAPGNAELRNRHRLLKGVIAWDLDRDFKARLWRERRGLRDLDAEIATPTRGSPPSARPSSTSRGASTTFAARIAALHAAHRRHADGDRRHAQPAGRRAGRHGRRRAAVPEGAPRELSRPGALRAGDDLRPRRRHPGRRDRTRGGRAHDAGALPVHHDRGGALAVRRRRQASRRHHRQPQAQAAGHRVAPGRAREHRPRARPLPGIPRAAGRARRHARRVHAPARRHLPRRRRGGGSRGRCRGERGELPPGDRAVRPVPDGVPRQERRRHRALCAVPRPRGRRRVRAGARRAGRPGAPVSRTAPSPARRSSAAASGFS